MPHRTGLLNPKSKEYTWHTTYTNTIKGLRAISYLRYSVRTQEWRVSRDRRRPAAGRWFWLLPRARDAQAHKAQPIGGGSTTRSLAESHVAAVKKAIGRAECGRGHGSRLAESTLGMTNRQPHALPASWALTLFGAIERI